MIRTVALSMLILLTGTSILFAQDDSSECIDRNQISESFNSQIFGLEQWRWLGIGVSFSARVIWNSGSNRSNNLAPVESDPEPGDRASSTTSAELSPATSRRRTARDHRQHRCVPSALHPRRSRPGFARAAAPADLPADSVMLQIPPLTSLRCRMRFAHNWKIGPAAMHRNDAGRATSLPRDRCRAGIAIDHRSSPGSCPPSLPPPRQIRWIPGTGQIPALSKTPSSGSAVTHRST